MADFLEKLVSVLLISMVVLIGIALFNVGVELKSNGYNGQTVSAKLYRYRVSPESNSMLPTMLSRDTPFAVNITSPSQITEGDIVTYRASDGDLILHRVVKILWWDGVPYYVLKGDANLIADNDLVTFGQLEKKIIRVDFK